MSVNEPVGPRASRPDPDREDAAGQLAERVQWVAAGRMGILILLAVATFAAFREDLQAPTPRLLLTGIGLGLTASIAYLVWLRVGRALRTLGLVQVLGDLLLWCLVVVLTGGAESAFSILFHLSVIVAAFLFGSRGAVLAAGTAAILFGATTLMLRAGLIALPHDLPLVSTLTVREVAYYLGVNTAGLSVVAALAGHLAEREQKAGGALEEARRASADLAALNEDIVRSLTSGLAAADRDDRVLWVNPAGAAILGHEHGALVGRPLGWVIPLAAARGGSEARVEREEAVVARPDGSRVTIGYKLAPLLDGAGASRGTLLVFQDLTELSAMREKVEHAERLAGLGRFAAAMAHEIRNPLGSISGSLEMLKESAGLGEEDRHLAGIMLRELDRLAALVSQMLEMARPSPAVRSEADLATMATEVLQVMAVSAEAEDVRIELEAPESLRASIDAPKVRQLLWNLIRNAVQASPAGGRVAVRLRGDDRAVVIEVEDRGSGVPVDRRERVFEPFYSTKRGGVGMGLSVCKQVAEGHGGAIAVDTGEDGGAVFRVELPAR